MNKDFFTGDLKQHNALNISPSTSKARRAGSSFLGWVVNNNSVIFTVVLLLFAATVLVISDFDFTGKFWQNVISTSTILLGACAYLLYINCYTTGSKTAEKSTFVKEVTNAYNNSIASIRERKIEWKIEVFCKEYRLNELERRKTEILLVAGFSESEIYYFLKNGVLSDDEKLTKEQELAINRARKVKPIKLNKAMIISPSRFGDRRNPIRSLTAINLYKYTSFLIKLITIIISCTFVVNLSVSLITDFTASAIIHAIVQLVLLATSIFGGMGLGYRTKTKYTERIQDIVAILFEFEEWNLKNKKETTNL